MKLSVTQENLTKALSSVSRVATGRTGLPILSNILLRTDSNRLQVAATNLEIAAVHYAGAKITTEGAITVPARLISEFVSNLPKGSVELEVKNDHLHISSGSYTSTINGVVADEFPELPSVDESSTVQYTLATDSFKQAVNQTIITSSNDSTRPILTGVYMHSHDGQLYLAATDGYRLSEKRLAETKSDISAIVPTPTLQEVLRTIDDSLDEIEMVFDDAQVRFRIGTAEITSRLIDGNYPDYRQLVPKNNDVSIVVDRQEFTRVAKIAGLFARESGGSVTLSADSDAGTVSIHSIASELGENTSEAAATVSASGNITLNSRYVLEALSVLSGDVVSIDFNGKLAPCLLRSPSDDSYLHIIMPLKS